MSAGNYDILIEQGATFQLDIYWSSNTQPPVPVDVTGYTGKMQVRSTVTSTTALATLTTANGGIIMGGSDGHVRLFMTSTDTLAINWLSGVYDLDVVSPTGFITRLLEGNVTVSQTATTI